MKWIWLLLILAAILLGIFWVGTRRRSKASDVEKYVCDVCHGSDCDCRRADTSQK